MIYSDFMFSTQGTLSYYSRANIIIWLTMAFQAGAINTGGFLSCRRFVSHMSGYGTLIGTEVAKSNFSQMLLFISIPTFFILGTMISASLVDRRIQLRRRPMYPQVMFSIFILTSVVLVAGLQGFFGGFGAEITPHEYLLLGALCIACGLQNATVTSVFGAVIRTTHLTGLTTDLGIGLVRVVTRCHSKHANEVRANWMRIGIISSFTLGSAFSSYFYLARGYWGFAIPASIAAGLFIWSLIRFFSQPRKQRPVG